MIVLGVLRGTVWGQLKTVDAVFATTYGRTWLVALIATILTAAWGERVISPAIDRINSIALADAVTADGRPTPALAAFIGAAKRNAALELLGFFVIFTCMILMRFGL